MEHRTFELNHENELLKEENRSLKKKQEECKEEAKKAAAAWKALEKELAAEKTKSHRAAEKLKERECDISIKKEYIQDLEAQYRELRDKNYK